MGKKRSVGVTRFAAFFIMLGVYQIIFPATLLFSYKANAPVLLPTYRRMVSVLNQVDNLRKQKDKEYDSNKQNMLNQTYIQLKQGLADYRDNYIYGVPGSMKIFACLSFLSAILFVYTGLIILRLNSSFRAYLTTSIIAGLFNSLAFYWQMSLGFYLPVRIADLTETVIAIDKDVVLPHMHSGLDIFKLFFLQPTNAIIYVGYLIFILILIYFFNHPKIKEQFE